MMMKMYFHFSIMETILFEKWMPETEFQMTMSCICLLVIAILLEYIKTFRAKIQSRNCSSTNCHTESSPISNHDLSDRDNLVLGWTGRGRNHLIDTVLYGIQLTVSYLLMLAAMTYNVWIFGAIIIGATIGYFLFGENTLAFDRTKDSHCN